MRTWCWKVFSITMILTLALAAFPAGFASADPGDAVIHGTITGVHNMGNFWISAYPIGGGDRCDGEVTWLTDHYEFDLNGCDHSRNYIVDANGARDITFTRPSVLSGTFSLNGGTYKATAAPIVPVDRIFSGIVYRPNRDPLENLTVNYEVTTPNDHDVNIQVNGSVNTDAAGIFTIPGVKDSSNVHVMINKDGYEFLDGMNDFWVGWPLRKDFVDQTRFVVYSRGRYWFNGHIESMNQNQGCKAGVTFTVTRDAESVGTVVSNADGNFNFWDLEPADNYIVTPSKSGCVFLPPSQTVNISIGGLQYDLVFKVPDSGIYGNVKPGGMGNSTMTSYASLAYYLIATYTTPNGMSYSSAVNWADGSYYIAVPPNAGGTLAISRLGGPAAFGYKADGATIAGLTIGSGWIKQDVILTPDRTISGTIVGQNGVPVQKNTWVDFGGWLRWMQPGTATSYTFKAQPKVYYLSPVENGILSSTPVRFLANLTTAPAVTTANFTLNLKTYRFEGCINSAGDGRDPLVLPPGSVRFRPAAGYGTVTYPADLVPDGCGPANYYFLVKLPKGIVGSLEADYHTLRGTFTIDGINNDMGTGGGAYGDRQITGHLYVANSNLDKFDTCNWAVLRDAATNQRVNLAGCGMEPGWNFYLPTLERKPYTLSFNLDNIPPGYLPYAPNLAPVNNIITSNLAAGDYDIPAAAGFVLLHKPLDPTHVTGGNPDPNNPVNGGYFTATGDTQTVEWNWPETNNQDRIRTFEIQIAAATAAFSDTSPAVLDTKGEPKYTFTGLTNGTLYRWRARTIFETDKGPWLETSPAPTSPQWAYLSGQTAGAVIFSWVPVSAAGAKYVVQYSDSLSFPSTVATVNLPAVQTNTTSTTTNPLAGKTYYWRVKAQNSSGVDISGWSPVQIFFNRYLRISSNPMSQLLPNLDGKWDKKPVQFMAADLNASLPPFAYYQVQVAPSGAGSYDDLQDWNVLTFPKPAGGAWSAYQYTDRLNYGDYQWRIRIVYGNDYRAQPITDWMDGNNTFHIGN